MALPVDLLLALLVGLCCLGLPAFGLGLPASLVAIRTARREPARRASVAALAALVNAVLVGPGLAIAGFAFGASIGDETAGEIAVGLATLGCGGGSVLGALTTFAFVHLAGRPRPLESAPAAPTNDRPANRALGCAIAALVLGVATSLAGLVFSVSIGLFTLAFATLVVRPLALAFVAVHLVTLGMAAHARANDSPHGRPRTRAALGVSWLGIGLAATIAVFGPSFFEQTMDSAIDFMLR